MNDSTTQSWLTIRQGSAPLIVSLPHTGVEIPAPFAEGLVSLTRARKDADWWIDKLYGFASDFGASVIHTAISRTVIDVNRDPSGASLYPGQATTELCPSTTFDGEPLYRDGFGPDAAAIGLRRQTFFDPYHDALAAEIKRLRERFPHVVLYDCHSIRSVIPRLFDGVLPQFNIGTNAGTSCGSALTSSIEAICDATGLTRVTNGRFKGGAITRRFGEPAQGVHAIQMELACRGYMHEDLGPVTEAGWPTPYDAGFAEPLRRTLMSVLEQAIRFATEQTEGSASQRLDPSASQ